MQIASDMNRIYIHCSDLHYLPLLLFMSGFMLEKPKLSLNVSFNISALWPIRSIYNILTKQCTVPPDLVYLDKLEKSG